MGRREIDRLIRSTSSSLVWMREERTKEKDDDICSPILFGRFDISCTFIDIVHLIMNEMEKNARFLSARLDLVFGI